MDLSQRINPSRTAVITVECQRGVIGEGAIFPALVDAVEESGMIANGQTVLAAARKARVPVLEGDDA